MADRNVDGRRLRATVAVALIASSALLGLPITEADQIEELPAEWPAGLGILYASAIWDGNATYIFGGEAQAGKSNQIFKFEPSTSAFVQMRSTLPSPRTCLSAVWSGRFVYIFGGQGDGAGLGLNPNLNEVLQYDPGTDQLSKLTAVLPVPRSCMAAVWDGLAAYLFGGYDDPLNGRTSNQVVKFDPNLGVVSVVAGVELPSGRALSSAVWTPMGAIIFGGFTDPNTRTDQILQFQSAGPYLTDLRYSLPTPRGTRARYGRETTLSSSEDHTIPGLTKSCG